MGVWLSCRRSLTEGDEELHLRLRVQALREFEDVGERDFITRAPAEMLGDSLQTRRALRQLMASLAEPTDAGPEGFGSEGEDPGERRARYSRGKRRRRLQAIWFFVIVLAYMVFRMVLDGS